MKNILIIIAVILIASCNPSPKMENKSSFKTIKENSNIFSGYAEVNGLKMYYEMHGNGAPLVLIHGGGSTIESTFGRVLPLFAERRKVIAVELQSHGHTLDINRPQTFENDADDVAALLDFLKIAKADIFGFSNGGNTTMQIAMRHPEKVGKIIIASSFFKREGMYPWFWEMMKNTTFSAMPQGLKDAYMKANPDSAGLLRMFENDKNRMNGFVDWKSSDVESIKSPALIINADQDVVTPEHSVEMMRLIPNARLSIIPGIHGAYIGESTTGMEKSKIPEMTVEMIMEFLDGK